MLQRPIERAAILGKVARGAQRTRNALSIVAIPAAVLSKMQSARRAIADELFCQVDPDCTGASPVGFWEECATVRHSEDLRSQLWQVAHEGRRIRVCPEASELLTERR